MHSIPVAVFPCFIIIGIVVYLVQHHACTQQSSSAPLRRGYSQHRHHGGRPAIFLALRTGTYSSLGEILRSLLRRRGTTKDDDSGNTNGWGIAASNRDSLRLLATCNNGTRSLSSNESSNAHALSPRRCHQSSRGLRPCLCAGTAGGVRW